MRNKTNAASPTPATLFGRVRMGYALVESRKQGEWRRFGAEALGLHVDSPRADVLAFRIDDHQRRLVVRNGPAEDVVALGWELDDDDALQLALSRVRAMGALVREGTDEDAALRGVGRFWSFVGPKRLGIELYIRPVRTGLPLVMKASGFVTGVSGMGHVAITTREPTAMLAFWQQVFDARISDRIEDRLNGIDLDFTFLRLNERHHSLALASTRGLSMNPLRTQIHHLNLQAASLDDVTGAYLRCRQMGCAIANGIGQHPNDRELSFYVATPSGFEIELGWNPIVVQDEQAWATAKYQGISLWGHFPEGLTMADKLGRVGRGLVSLTQPEFTLKAGGGHELNA